MGLWGYFWWGLQNNLEKQHASTRACLLSPGTFWAPLVTSLTSSPRKALAAGSLERPSSWEKTATGKRKERRGALNEGAHVEYPSMSRGAAEQWEDRKSLGYLSTAPFSTPCLSRGMTSVGLTHRTECFFKVWR